MKMEKLIDVKNLFYKIPLGEIVLDKVSFTLSTGEFMGVLGRNGIGKSLFRIRGRWRRRLLFGLRQRQRSLFDSHNVI